MHQEWLDAVVGKDDLTRHEKWLCMMLPRLVLLRELLRDDGVIFISIDDNEVHHLRAVMDEIFGEENLIAVLPWRGRGGGADTKHIVILHEYVLLYARNKEAFTVGEAITFGEGYSKFDGAKKRRYKTQLARKWGSNSRREDRPNLYYAVTAPDGKKVFPKLPNGEDGCWRWSKSKMQSEIDSGNVEFVKVNGNWVVYERIYEPTEDEVRTKKYSTWLDDVGNTANGTDEIKEIFEETVFSFPKPTSLIKRLAQIADIDDDDIILDSFAGSGTTAHAVLALNAEDGGNRKFILIEQEDYADTITAERVRRVMRGVKKSKDEQLQKGFGGTFSYFTLGAALDDDAVLSGKTMPAYLELARYVFFTATGEQLDENQVDEARFYLGESKQHTVYLLYQPDVEFLKNTPLNLAFAQALGRAGGKPRLVIASHKYLDDDRLREMRIEFCQLPFAIYRFRA